MSLYSTLGVQGRVISALVLHETKTRYGRNKLGFFWALFEPLAHLLVFIGIFAAMGRSVPIGDNMGLFILTGIIPWILFSNIVNNVMRSLNSDKALLGYPQVMPFDIILSRLIIESSTLIVVMLIFLGCFSYLGFKIKVDNFLQMASAYGLLILLAAGIGMINIVIIDKFSSYENIYRAFSRPLYFISGVFFTADFLSPEVYEIIDFNPLIHLIEWFRSGYYTSFQSDLYDPIYTIAVCLIVFFIGLIFERIHSKKVRQA